MRETNITHSIEFVLSEAESIILKSVGYSEMRAKLSELFPNYQTGFGVNVGWMGGKSYDTLHVRNINPCPISTETVIGDVTALFKGLYR